MKKEVTLKNGKLIQLTVRYDIGSNEAWNKKERGYYFSVVPVEKEIRDGLVFTKVVAYSGFKGLALAVKRKSAKAEEEAIQKTLDMFPIEKLEQLFSKDQDLLA